MATVAPSINWRELRSISRTIGSLLTIVGGLVLLVQIGLGDLTPVPQGYQSETAKVFSREQVGTFQNPAFLVTLEYDISNEIIRSGRRVDYELYRSVPTGTEVTIQYNMNDPFEWRITRSPQATTFSDYGIGLLMVIIGGFSLVFPSIVRLASREEDFVQAQRIPAS